MCYPAFLETWIPEVNKMNAGKVGEPYFYPDSMIRFLAVLYGKGFDYRALQGIMRGLSRHFYDFPVISFSQIRRRMLELPLTFNSKADDLVVGIDGSGMKVSNRGEWIRQAWGIRRGWIKVVILGDSEGNIVDIRVGNEDLDERKSGRGMLRKNSKNVKKAMMDGLHDCEDTFNLCKKLEIEPAIKIRDNASEKTNQFLRSICLLTLESWGQLLYREAIVILLQNLPKSTALPPDLPLPELVFFYKSP
ncbi:MAG: transposase [Euryarchaeota archaeon]|nr:transposase [Euryarchaeota archaeon]